MSGEHTDALPGLDLVGLRAYLDAAVPGLVSGPLEGRVVAGGKSNLTYVVTDGAGSWVVRAPRWATCWPPRTTCPASTG